MNSLMHHSGNPKHAGMRNPNQCSKLCLKCQFTPPAFNFLVHNAYGLLQPTIIMDTQDVHILSHGLQRLDY